MEMMAALLQLTFQWRPISNVKKGTLHTPTLNGQVLKNSVCSRSSWSTMDTSQHKAGFFQNQFNVGVAKLQKGGHYVQANAPALERKSTSPTHQLNENFPIDLKPAATRKCS